MAKGSKSGTNRRRRNGNWYALFVRSDQLNGNSWALSRRKGAGDRPTKTLLISRALRFETGLEAMKAGNLALKAWGTKDHRAPYRCFPIEILPDEAARGDERIRKEKRRDRARKTEAMKEVQP